MVLNSVLKRRVYFTTTSCIQEQGAHFTGAEARRRGSQKIKEIPHEDRFGRSLGYNNTLSEVYTPNKRNQQHSPSTWGRRGLSFFPAIPTGLLVRERRCERESLSLWKGKTRNRLHFTTLKVGAYRDIETICPTGSLHGRNCLHQGPCLY